MAAPSALHQALAHLQRGEWQAAHAIVQRDDSPAGCWLHAIVHVMEGDPDNARYWYRRAQRPFCGDCAAEIAAAKASIS